MNSNFSYFLNRFPYGNLKQTISKQNNNEELLNELQSVQSEISNLQQEISNIESRLSNSLNNFYSIINNKVNTVDLKDYLSSSKALPLGAVYLYEGRPISHQRIIQDGAESYTLYFCISHIDAAENLGVNYLLFTNNGDEFYFRDSYDDINAPEYVLKVFNELDYSQDINNIRSDLQNYYNKQQINNLINVPIITVPEEQTSILAEINKCYRCEGTVNDLAIILPNPKQTDKTLNVSLFITTGEAPAVTIGSESPVVYYSGYEIKPSMVYEISMMWNGEKWIIAYGNIN